MLSMCVFSGNVISGAHASLIYGGLRAQSTRANRKNTDLWNKPRSVACRILQYII